MGPPKLEVINWLELWGDCTLSSWLSWSSEDKLWKNPAEVIEMRRTSAFGVAVFLLTLSFVVPEESNALGIELEGRYWLPDVNGSASLADFDLPPILDIGDLLALEADGVPEGRFTFRILLGFYVRATYQKMDNSGQRSLGDILDISEIPFPIDASVSSNLDFDYGRLALGWRFVFPKKVFSIGAFAEAKGFSGDASASLDSSIFSDSVSESFEAIIPSVGVVAEINPSEKWQIFGEVSLAVGYDDADMADWELGLRYYPTSIFGIGAGYRVMDLEGRIDNVLLDVDWKGAFLTGMLKF